MRNTSGLYTLNDFNVETADDDIYEIDLDDIEDLDDLDDFDDIEDLDDIEDDSYLNEDNLSKFDEEIVCHNINSSEATTIKPIGNDYSYSREIKEFETTLFDTSTILYNYQLIKPRHMLARFFYLINKARQGGILRLREDIDTEPNQLIKMQLCMAIDGWEPKSVFRVMEMKKKQYKKTFLQYGTSDVKKEFIDRVLQDFEAIAYGMLYIQSGSEKSEFEQICSAIYKDDNLHFESEDDFKSTHEEYLNINKPFRLLNKSETSHIEIKTESDIKLLLDIFNKKRDEVENMELLTLENPYKLFTRLLEYNEMARNHGILNLFPSSLAESNILLRHSMQLALLGTSPDDVLEFMNKYKDKQISLAKKYHNETFCVLFEKEMDFISRILLAIMAGDNSTYLKVYAISFYPELTILTEEK